MMSWANHKRPIRITVCSIGSCSIWDFIMNITTFPWSRGTDCPIFIVWLQNFTRPYLRTNHIHGSFLNFFLIRKSAHLIGGCAMIHILMIRPLRYGNGCMRQGEGISVWIKNRERKKTACLRFGSLLLLLLFASTPCAGDDTRGNPAAHLLPGEFASEHWEFTAQF